jgi:hypothetical protein
MCTELKIKSKHLALEPQVIRHEEDKLKGQIKYLGRKDDDVSYRSRIFTQLKLDSLIAHRRWNVRNEARATDLARAYLKGKPYLTVEKRAKCNDVMFKLYIVPRIVAMVTKYGKGDQRRIDRKTIEMWSKV